MVDELAHAGSAKGDLPRLSLVISTLGRTTSIAKLMDSLLQQDDAVYEVIFVDQNEDDRLDGILAGVDWPFGVLRIRTPTERGLSRGRNVGWRIARGDVVLFPDDDCWYPAGMMRRALQQMQSGGISILAGRAADEDGRSINGRFETSAVRITRANVWITGIEWVVFFARSALDRLHGFDQSLGVGADSPWQACEGQDIMLRALDAGMTCHFDPAIYGHHEELNIRRPDRAMQSKGRNYGRGLGHVLRVHGFGTLDAMHWIGRPLARAGLSCFNLNRCRYYANVAFGRLEGWAGLSLGQTQPRHHDAPPLPTRSPDHQRGPS